MRHTMDMLGLEKARDFELGADGLLRFKGDCIYLQMKS